MERWKNDTMKFTKWNTLREKKTMQKVYAWNFGKTYNEKGTNLLVVKNKRLQERERGKMKKMNKVLNEENDTPAPIYVYLHTILNWWNFIKLFFVSFPYIQNELFGHTALLNFIKMNNRYHKCLSSSHLSSSC